MRDFSAEAAKLISAANDGPDLLPTFLGGNLFRPLIDSPTRSAPYDEICVDNLGKVRTKLHSRNKSNVQRLKGYRPIAEEDAELALQALGFTLRDLHWSRN